ncbi:MAG TPA: hypothetical protein VK867_04250 [Candidatus Limnocylindrales bacterium]|nr:hypothetical protein [Candidatus Limnocylindrales bacterium]
MTQTKQGAPSGFLIGPGAGLGAGIGLIFALLSGIELPMGLVFGAAVGLLVGLAVDALGSGDRHDDDPHHPLMMP